MDSERLSERLLEFASRVCGVVDKLPKSQIGAHIADQLVRSGTSPGPNYEEACAAESRRDFIHKMRIALKELRETRFWIKLIIRTKLLPEHRLQELLAESNELCNIFGQSILTARQNSGQD